MSADFTDLTIKQDQHFDPDSIHKFNNVAIKNSTLGINKNRGRLTIRTENNISVENGKIDVAGYGNSPDYGWLARRQSITEFPALNELFLGSNGHAGDSCSGGTGGGALKIECNELFMDGVMWWCGAGSGGSILIICNELFMDGKSELLARSGYDYHDGKSWPENGNGRIVIKINGYLPTDSIKYLVYGYLRNITKDNGRMIKELCELCVAYCSFNDYKNYKISPKPIFVDKDWKEIEEIVTLNHWKTGRVAPSGPWFR